MSGNSIQLEIGGPGLVAKGTLTKGATAPAPPSVTGVFDGSYVGGANMSLPAGPNMRTAKVTHIIAQISGGKLTGLGTTACGTFRTNLSVSPSGDISGKATVPDAMQCAAPLSAKAIGRVSGINLQLDMVATGLHIQGTLVKQ